jgi:hypothetical protein
MYALIIALDIVFFHNRNHSLADKKINFAITFNKEVLANIVFFENIALSQTFCSLDNKF